jgi:hypothetical protein
MAIGLLLVVAPFGGEHDGITGNADCAAITGVQGLS